MNNLIKKLKNSLSFTRTEQSVLLTLLLVMAFGVALNLMKYTSEPPIKKHSYSLEDSLFMNYQQHENNDKSAPVTDKTETKQKKESIKQIGKVNINTASIEILTKLPGVGEKTAEKIIEYRKSYGKFKSSEDIMNVKGIGKGKYEKMKDFILTIN